MDGTAGRHGLEQWHGTTIIGVKKGDRTVIAGDGQVSMGNTVMKPNAKKVRRLGKDGTVIGGFAGATDKDGRGKVIGGFAGATADAFTLFERLEKKLEAHNGQLMRAAVELAKDWRTDKYLRNLEAMMIVADKDVTLVLTGTGDVLTPDHSTIAIGSGGNYAYSAALALAENTDMDAEEIARKAMKIAAEICIYTNESVTLEKIEA